MEQLIFRNICKEIMRECNNRGIKASERFIVYYVNFDFGPHRYISRHTARFNWSVKLRSLEIEEILNVLHRLQKRKRHKCYWGHHIMSLVLNTVASSGTDNKGSFLAKNKTESEEAVLCVKLLLLNPKWKISVDSMELNRMDLQKLVKYTYSTLDDEYNPAVIALKMQMYFQCSFDTNVNVISNYRKKLDTQILPLEQEILKFRSTDELELKRLVRMLINFITLKSGLGNPACEQVYDEAESALRSVFNRSEISKFGQENNVDTRYEQLAMLTKLVAGIRLFNGKGLKTGEGIEDLPTLLVQADEQLCEDLQKILIDVMDFVNVLTSALDYSYSIQEKDGKAILKLSLSEESKYTSYINYFKDTLVLFRQFEVFVRKLIDEVHQIREKLAAIFEEFEKSLKDIYTIVHHKTMVQASIIYPQFVRLADVWYAMQNEVICLSNIHNILQNLRIYSEQVHRFEDIILHMLQKKPVLTDEDRMQKTGMHRLAALGCKDTKILNPSKIPNFEQEPLEILGFCIWKFVESEGALIPGNPGNGVVRIKKRYYVFSCLEAVQEFVKDPERYIKKALKLVRRKPELIHFLQLYDQLNELKTVTELVPPRAATKKTSDEGIQTDEHLVRSHIDPDYMWNIWDWKRKALKMADISRKTTRSTQTTASGYKSSIKVQTHYHRHHYYQTKKDAWTSVPTPSNFIFGLRGRKDDKQFIVTLTRPVEE